MFSIRPFPLITIILVFDTVKASFQGKSLKDYDDDDVSDYLFEKNKNFPKKMPEFELPYYEVRTEENTASAMSIFLYVLFAFLLLATIASSIYSYWIRQYCKKDDSWSSIILILSPSEDKEQKRTLPKNENPQTSAYDDDDDDDDDDEVAVAPLPTYDEIMEKRTTRY